MQRYTPKKKHESQPFMRLCNSKKFIWYGRAVIYRSTGIASINVVPFSKLSMKINPQKNNSFFHVSTYRHDRKIADIYLGPVEDFDFRTVLYRTVP